MILAIFPHTTTIKDFEATARAVKKSGNLLASFGFPDTVAATFASCSITNEFDASRFLELQKNSHHERRLRKLQGHSIKHAQLIDGKIITREFYGEDFIDFAKSFALVITAHPAFAHFLPELIYEWDRQAAHLPIKKILAFDGDFDEIGFDLPDDWRVIGRDEPFGEPSPLRNLALLTPCDWLQYWDADNEPVGDHLMRAIDAAYHAAEDVGCLFTTPVRDNGQAIEAPFDLDPRRKYFVDTSSVWRREAMLSVGGWRVGFSTEDWRLSCDLSLAGWKLEPSGILFNWANSEDGRTARSLLERNLWNARTYGIITLLRGDYDFADAWLEDLAKIKVPQRAGITVVIDGDDRFFEYVMSSAKFVGEKFERVTIMRAQPAPVPTSDFITIHSRVADHYARAIRATPEDYVLTWEDDVRPEPDALMQLSASHPFLNLGDFGGIAAPYITRGGEEKQVVAACLSRDYWRGTIFKHDLTPDTVERVGMIAGGFTLWSRRALEDCPLLGPVNIRGEQGFLGWDGFLCRRLNAAGWQLGINSSSKVRHFPK